MHTTINKPTSCIHFVKRVVLQPRTGPVLVPGVGQVLRRPLQHPQGGLRHFDSAGAQCLKFFHCIKYISMILFDFD